MTVSAARRSFTVADYERMGEAGIIGEDERVELIRGEILEMSPIGDSHVGRVIFLTNLLVRHGGPDTLVSVQNPLRLSDDSEPQPDIVLLRAGSPLAVPTAADVLLVIEVADSSRHFDRSVKLPLYAAAGIPEAWLVDLVGEILERHSDPRDGVYQRIETAHRGQSLASTIVFDLSLSADAVLG